MNLSCIYTFDKLLELMIMYWTLFVLLGIPHSTKLFLNVIDHTCNQNVFWVNIRPISTPLCLSPSLSLCLSLPLSLSLSLSVLLSVWLPTVCAYTYSFHLSRDFLHVTVSIYFCHVLQSQRICYMYLMYAVVKVSSNYLIIY